MDAVHDAVLGCGALASQPPGKFAPADDRFFDARLAARQTMDELAASYGHGEPLTEEQRQELKSYVDAARGLDAR
jgi:hypothetical protein